MDKQFLQQLLLMSCVCFSFIVLSGCRDVKVLTKEAVEGVYQEQVMEVEAEIKDSLRESARGARKSLKEGATEEESTEEGTEEESLDDLLDSE